MKILVLGYDPFLTLFLSELLGTEFKAEHDLTIVNATGIRSPRKTKKQSNKIQLKIKKGIRKIKKLNYEKVVFQLSLRKYPWLKSKVSEKLFKPKSFATFQSEHPEPSYLPYMGLASFKDLSDYELMIVATFGELIPPSIFEQPRYGTINIHPSYLPELRGGYPTYIQAISANFKKGITIHQMSAGFDEGAILAQTVYSDAKSLTHSELFKLGALSASELVKNLLKQQLPFQGKSQENLEASSCRDLLRPKWALSSFNPNDDLMGYVRANHAIHQFPYTYTSYKGKLFMILGLDPESISTPRKGAFVTRDQDGFSLYFHGRLFKVTQYIYITDLIKELES